MKSKIVFRRLYHINLIRKQYLTTPIVNRCQCDIANTGDQFSSFQRLLCRKYLNIRYGTLKTVYPTEPECIFQTNLSCKSWSETDPPFPIWIANGDVMTPYTKLKVSGKLRIKLPVAGTETKTSLTIMIIPSHLTGLNLHGYPWLCQLSYLSRWIMQLYATYLWY